MLLLAISEDFRLFGILQMMMQKLGPIATATVSLCVTCVDINLTTDQVTSKNISQRVFQIIQHIMKCHLKILTTNSKIRKMFSQNRTYVMHIFKQKMSADTMSVTFVIHYCKRKLMRKISRELLKAAIIQNYRINHVPNAVSLF